MTNLANKWVLYDHIKSDSDSYESSTRRISEFDNIIDFWKIFNHYFTPSKIFTNENGKPIVGIEKRKITGISVFKNDILPKWEDSFNKNGGEISKRKYNSLEELDNEWESLLLYSIGNNFNEKLTGIRVVDSSVKKNDDTFKLMYRIEIWFSDKNEKELFENEFKKCLNINSEERVFYKEHLV